MKRITALILAALVLGLTACTPQTDDTGVMTTTQEMVSTTSTEADIDTTTVTNGVTTVTNRTTTVVCGTTEPVESMATTTTSTQIGLNTDNIEKTTSTAVKTTTKKTTVSTVSTTTTTTSVAVKVRVDRCTYIIENEEATLLDVKDSLAQGELVLPESVNGYPLTTIAFQAFKDAPQFTSVVLPDSVKELKNGAFRSARTLKTIVLGEGLTTIGGVAFFGCHSLTAIHIPEKVTSIGSDPFAGCNALVSVTVAPNNTEYYAVDNVLFRRSSKTLMYYPKTKTNTAYAIPDGIEEIGEKAFNLCSALQSLTIPLSLEEVKASAFFGCTNLTDVYYGGSEQDRQEMFFDDTISDLFNAEWHYNAK